MWNNRQILRELSKLWNMKMMVIPNVNRVQSNNWNNPENSTVKISKNTLKSFGELKKDAAIQISAEIHL